MQRAILSLIVSAAGLLAQSSAGGGSIQGIVKDATGAVVPQARVTITALATNSVVRTESNAGGFFLTPPMNIGAYRVRIEFEGMKTWETEVRLETGRISELNAVLQPGQVSETVQVTASAPLVTTTEATDASTLDAQRIKEIPVNGRNLNVLLETVAPGVEAINDVNGGIRVSGLMTYSTDYVQDGANANNREFGGSANLQGLESIGEVRVETSTSSARYTRPTSVIVSTKSGTNRLLFSVFETHRNNAFGVARARQDVNLDGRPYRVPKLIRNEFGGTVGGPVVIPSFGANGRKALYDGRDRTFFFYSREGTEFVQGVTREFRVPTAEMRGGDFSSLFDNQGRRLQLYDPDTTRQELINGRFIAVRDPFSNNRIPIERLNSFAKRIYEITPLPTDITNPLVSNNLKVVVPINSLPNLSDNPQVLKIDHNFTPNDKFFIKMNGGLRSAHFLGTGGATGAPTLNNEANMTYLPMRGRAVALSLIHTFSPTFFVETLANRTWQLTRTVTGPEDRNWAAELGLPNPLNEIGWPEITNTGFMSYVEGDNRRQLYSMISNAEQNYKLVRRRHSLGWGWRWHAEKQNLLPDQGAISGAPSFNSLATALESSTLGTTINPGTTPQTGFDGANFFLGYAGNYRVGFKRGIMRVREQNWGLYFEDTWRVNDRLTLFPGARWDINPAFYEKDGQLTAFDLQSRSIMMPENLDHYYKLNATTPKIVQSFQAVGVKFASAGELGKPKQLFPSNLFDIGPRGGFAYNLQRGEKPWVLRGGYGLYISAVPMRTLLAQFSGLAPFRANFSWNPNAANQSPDGIVNYLLRNQPLVRAGVNSAGVIDVDDPATVGRGQGVVGMDGRQPSLRIHEWNLALEKQISKTTVVRLTYKGKRGVNSDQLYNINAQPPDYIWYLTTGRAIPGGEFSGVLRRPYDRNAYTDVRILQRSGIINSTTWVAEIERRFRNGLGFQLFYTLTNALRLAGNSFRDDVVPTQANFLPGTVPTDFKELNRFLFYDRDTAVPKHRVRWNWSYDMPFGRRGHFFKGVGRTLDNLIGGWKLSGTGTVVSTWYVMPTGNWGEMGNFEVYRNRHKVLDCQQTPITSSNFADERCIEGYLWFNGYISERLINARNAAGLRIGIFGLPDNYKPAQKPINPWPKGGLPTDPNNADYDTNVVYLPLLTGGVVRVNYDTGLHPWRNQSRLGPFNWTMDSSLMKTFLITENRVNLRLTVDMFNVFNVQGLNVPAANGIASLQNSYGGFGIRPRQLQVGARLQF
ncbi:MAG: TonB-dependent receptor [Acidobacteria bacterium]|nr:TonB-dependent receptor [Acidobacteriota bacterium]